VATFFELHAIAQYSALRIVDSLAEGTIIALFAALLLGLTRRQNAGTKFAIGFSALIAIAIVPFMAAPLYSRVILSRAVASRPAITLPDSWALYLFAAWGVIASVFLLGIGRGLWHLHVLRRNCLPVEISALDLLLRETIRCSRTKRHITVRTSDYLRVPTALGLMKPAIVIPRWALRELSPAELNQVFLHELAHLRRWDDWTNFIQQVVKAIFFFHPAVWWIENKAALEREIACDDAVLAETASPRAYAECLAHLAERSFIQRSLALAQAALGRIHQISSRVARILDPNRALGSGPSWKPLVAMIAAFAIACAVLESRMPTLIAFEDSQPLLSAESPRAAQSADIQDGLKMLVHNASLPQPQADARITSTKFHSEPASNPAKMRKRSTSRRSEILRPKPGRLVHLAKADATPPPVSETVFVFIQSSDQSAIGQQIYQIQMWRVTLLRYVQEPASSKAPPKKT
jgi:beta-lactamase regulating signal transducer with metallopeptidase domain